VDYQQRRGKAFKHKQYPNDLTASRDRIKATLSEPPKAGDPSVVNWRP